MKPPAIPLEKIAALPEVYRFVVPEDYRDAMGHMNMRWYLALYDEAGIPLFADLGMTLEHYRQNQAGGFDLEHHIHYLNEVRIGDTLSIRARLVGRSAKRLHYLLFMVNETRGLLSSIFECVNSYADLTARRTAPFPPEVVARIDAALAAYQHLDWDAPVCGVMRA